MYSNRRTSASAIPRLPAGAQQPAVTVPNPLPPNIHDSYTFQITPPGLEDERLQNPWDNQQSRFPPTSFRPRVQSMHDPHSPRVANVPYRGAPYSAVSYDSRGQQRFPFPEPMIYGVPPPPPIIHPPQGPTRHQYSKSDLGISTSNLNVQALPHKASVVSLASSYGSQNGDMRYSSESNEGHDDDTADLARGLADLSISSEEALRRFQAGELPENDQEWHRLVPPEAREALGKQEVQRQSVIFEVIKSERDYVADLEAVQSVFIAGLRTTKPPIIAEPRLEGFIKEVFGNLNDVLVHHQRLLGALFTRQHEQHPLIQSVADILLDTTLNSSFRAAYETYIKHYPLAESHHRLEMKRNKTYETFIQSVSADPRIRKRDLVTFLSRPVTKLPRLNLLLEQILKLTETAYEHPDLEALPIILGIVGDCVRATQPGIEAAEGKVKFWALCESLVFQKGEIIDMDLYDDSRSLVYAGPVMRRAKSETGFTEKWTELSAALLDNYFILSREDKRPNGVVRRFITSRPLPLSFLRLGSFTGTAETRREKADDGGLLEGWRSQTVSVYPFTIYHAANPAMRRYTLYAATESQRKKWFNAFVDALGVHQVRQEANMWFSPQTLTDGFFRGRTTAREGNQGGTVKGTGKARCAAPIFIGGRRLLAVGCSLGIYAAPTNSEHYKLVLNHRNPTALAALTTLNNKVFNRLVVHADTTIITYSLDIVARLAAAGGSDSSDNNDKANRQALEASVERIGSDMNIVICKHVHVGGRALLIYSLKKMLSTSLTLQVLEAVDTAEAALAPKRATGAQMRTFRPFGDPGFIPKDAHDICALAKTIGVCTNSGIVTIDPRNLAKSAVAMVPDFRDANNNEPMTSLKARLEDLKPLGFVRATADELLVIYDEIGFYINKHGAPVRSSGYIKWETKAISYAHRNGHILLISPDFIEVRNIATSRIVQVLEGRDMRLLYAGPYVGKEYPVLVAMRGSKDDGDGVSDKIVELTETEEISATTPMTATSRIWDEWDI